MLTHWTDEQGAADALWASPDAGTDGLLRLYRKAYSALSRGHRLFTDKYFVGLPECRHDATYEQVVYVMYLNQGHLAFVAESWEELDYWGRSMRVHTYRAPGPLPRVLPTQLKRLFEALK